MSMDAGGLAHMSYNNNPNSFPAGNGLGTPGSGFGGGRSRLNSKRLSVALPPKINSIDEHQVDNPTPRTSRSYLLAGLRTQPKVPASAPYHQLQHHQGLPSSGYEAYEQGMPQSAMANGFDMASQYASNAGRQMYSLPEQVLAPPSLNEHGEEMDPAVLQQMQLTSLYLAQRQQQLQQQLANITAAAQGMNLNGNNNPQANLYQQQQQNYMLPQNMYPQQQQQVHSPMEVPGQPGVYLVYNPAIQGYSYVFDQQAQQQQAVSPSQQGQAYGYFNPATVSPPATERSTPTNNTRSFTPPKKAPTPPFSSDKPVEPLPPPSSNAFRRGHKKSPSSLSLLNNSNISEGPKTSSAATFASSQRSTVVIPPPPLTGNFLQQPGSNRAGDHPIRQPRGPPPLEELSAAPTSKYENSKNFATRQRRAALSNLRRAAAAPGGSSRRAVLRSANGSPVGGGFGSGSGSEAGSASSSANNGRLFLSGDDVLPATSTAFGFDAAASSSAGGSRRMSPIGSEMQEKRRGSRGSGSGSSSSTSPSLFDNHGALGAGGYFGFSPASTGATSSGDEEEEERVEDAKGPVMPAEAQQQQQQRKKLMLGVLNAAEKRRVGGGGSPVVY